MHANTHWSYRLTMMLDPSSHTRSQRQGFCAAGRGQGQRAEVVHERQAQSPWRCHEGHQGRADTEKGAEQGQDLSVGRILFLFFFFFPPSSPLIAQIQIHLLFYFFRHRPFFPFWRTNNLTSSSIVDSPVLTKTMSSPAPKPRSSSCSANP